jgi:hypothetical protein
MNWTMVICTLDRFEVLKIALRTVLWQSRLPRQVIIVDASADWQRCREEVLREFAVPTPGIEWIYIDSAQRSLTHQRNLGLARCTSEIVFLFDDDSYLFRDCARRIMALYEQDLRGEVGGVNAGLRSTSPLDSDGRDPLTGENPAPRPNTFTGWREVIHSLWYAEKLFIPYDGWYYNRMPEWARGNASLLSVNLFHGCRMTFRTDAVREAGGCEEVLVRHGFGEDIDLSYRVSRRHSLLLDMDACVFHATAPASRTGRVSQATLVLLNSVVLYLLHGTDARNRRSRVLRFMLGRFAVEFARDAAKPWRGFPNTRGVIGAFRRLPQLAGKSRSDLRRIYPQMQQQITDASRRAAGTPA